MPETPTEWTDAKGRIWSGFHDGFTDHQGNRWHLASWRDGATPLFASPAFRNLKGSTIAGIYAWLGPLTGVTLAPPDAETSAPAPTREHAAENLAMFLKDVLSYGLRGTPEVTLVGERPDLDETSRLGFPRFAFEVESAKRTRRFTILMPGLPLAEVRRFRAEEPKGLEERERIAVKVADDRASSWESAIADCAREADYQTPAEAIAGLLGRF